VRKFVEFLAGAEKCENLLSFWQVQKSVKINAENGSAEK
jgi:hypothetical protein